jgi:hypothetical protein
MPARFDSSAERYFTGAGLSGDAEAEAACRTLMAVMRPRFRAIALEALGQLHQQRQQPDAAAPLIAEAAELRQALAASAR